MANVLKLPPCSILPLILLQQWKSLMHSGLEASRERRPELAQAFYLRAIDIAQALLGSEPQEVTESDRIAAFVVTHLNLADTCAEGGQPDDAVPCLCEAHGALVMLIKSEGVPEPMRLAASYHIRETYLALLLHCSTFGEHPDIRSTLNACGMTLPSERVLH